MRNALLTIAAGLLLALGICLGSTALAQPADPEPGMDAPREAQLAWSISHRVYRTQLQLDGSTAVYEYRLDDGQTHAGPAGCPGGVDIGGQHQCATRRVSPDHQTYLAWLAAGHQPQTLPPEVAPPRPTISEADLAAQVAQATQAERDALGACVADLQVAQVLGGPGPDCRPAAEAYQLARETADTALRQRYEVTP